MQNQRFEFDTLGYCEQPEYFDWCLGQTVQALIEDGKEELACTLLACRLSWKFYAHDNANYIRVTLHGPMSAIPVCHTSMRENPVRKIV